MAVDSEAVFAARVQELQLQDRLGRFDALGWKTYGSFAFALPAGAGGVVAEDEFARMVTRPLYELAEADPLPAAAAAVRRLWFESHTLAVSDLRSKLDRTEADAPRKIPQAEREARKEVIRAKLEPALHVSGDLEPANCVIDRFCAMLEDGVLEYVAWEDVPKREQELAVGPTKRRWAPDASGVVREKAVKTDPAADVSSALRISWALQRRGIALEISGLMSYDVHERIRNKLITALTKDSPDPHYRTASIDQLRAADKEIWKQLSNLAKGKLRAATPRDEPLEDYVDQVLAMMEVNLILMPLPAGGGAKRKQEDNDGPPPEKTSSTRSRRRARQMERLKKQTAEGRPSPSQGGGKGGGKGKRNFGPPMPQQLVGGVAELPDGRRICFGFNLNTCNKAQAGAACDKGVHVCTKRGCGGAHRASECSH
ncbi:MAG: hypothetical protein GY772_07695 [bacterium]|nr:hypothetical protein [bacterium]